SPNSVPLGRPLSAVPRPATIVLMQEAWSLSHQLWNQPEPNTRTDSAFDGNSPTTYQEWHMWASYSTHESFVSKTFRENLSNAHSSGGNLVFVDGHAEYKKYLKLRTGDFGLTPDNPHPANGREDGRSYQSAF